MDGIKLIIMHALSSAVRQGLVVLGALMASHHLPFVNEAAQSEITNTIVGCLIALIGYVWSVTRSHKIVKAKNDALGVNAEQQDANKIASIGGILLFSAFMTAASTGCAIVSHFDQNTYDGAHTIKTEALALILKGNEKAADHSAEIESLKVKLSSQLAYEQGKGKSNVISFTQWDIIASLDHDLLGGFLKLWESGKTFSPAFLTEKAQQVSDAFDQVLKLEGAKNK